MAHRLSPAVTPIDEHDEYVSVAEFRKHPLERENPWLRPHPEENGSLRARPEEDPYEELCRRGATYAGEVVEVVDVSPAGDIAAELTGEASIRTSPFSPIQTVPIAELGPTTRREVRFDPQIRVPEYYEHEIAFKEELAAASPIDVFCPSSNRRWAWRWKLSSYYNIRPGVRESCDTLIVDSGFNRWGSPDDVLEAAAHVDADWVFATDVTGMEEPYACPVKYCRHKCDDEDALRTHITNKAGRHEGLDGYNLPERYEQDLYRDAHNPAMPSTADPGIETHMDAALEGIRRFIERAREVGCLHKTILPLQPPYEEFLTACEAHGWLDDVRYVAVGGLLTIDDVDDRIAALHTVRNHVGPDMKIHALAPGTDLEMIRELRNNSTLLDSLDVSTPEVAPGNNKIPDATWKQKQRLLPYGEDIATVRGAFSSAIALQLTHMLSPLCKDRTFEEAAAILDDDDAADDDDRSPQEQATDDGLKTLDEWATS